MSRARCVIVLVYLGASPAFALETRYHASERAKLMEVYREAVMHDSELAAARADFEARRETIPQARANLLPIINSGATIESTRLVREEPQLTRSRNGTTFQANLKQPLFNAEFWFGLKAAEATTSQASLELSAKEQELILKSAEAYFETLRASDERAASEAEETALKQQMDQAQARLKGGLSSITDVLDAQAAFDNAQANRKLAERKVDDAFEQMMRLTNHVYESIEGIQHKLPILPPVPEDVKTWVDAALRQNLMLQASNHAVQAAEETLSQRQAGHAPTLDVVASYRKGDNDSFGYSNPTDFGRNGYQGNVSQSSIALQVNVPLYTGGRVNSQARESYKRLTQSEELRETQRREVVLNTRNFYRAVNSDIEQILARKKTILSSQRSLKASKVGADIGTRNTVDVLNAQRQLFNAVRDYNNARYDYILNNLRLKQAAGTLSPLDLENLAQYLKADYEPRQDFLPPELTPEDFKQRETKLSKPI
ncbi:TolC family outer membrane protein [Pseudomonas chlororaphis]|uniref:TolC family outer membrane protein n=1 Tax=Pseudomonas chlororaphis TaxID=587753 RepID=UPI0023655CE2|nr:TolC family outer membrane protein [Pseudomonas chlororaphis]WDG52372.1 TolC family outer membrane protein [Pseudomonas chlororaphis]WDH86611.1 TolC family outer membrane protein [Pseudomonas chlororaphis]